MLVHLLLYTQPACQAKETHGLNTILGCASLLEAFGSKTRRVYVLFYVVVIKYVYTHVDAYGLHVTRDTHAQLENAAGLACLASNWVGVRALLQHQLSSNRTPRS